MEFIALENEIVKLKPLELNDLSGILEAASYPEIWSHMSTTIEKMVDVNNFVENALLMRRNRTEFPFVIVDKKTGEIIGSTRFMDIDDTHQRVEIGTTWLTPAYWRTAINTNCKYLLIPIVNTYYYNTVSKPFIYSEFKSKLIMKIVSLRKLLSV